MRLQESLLIIKWAKIQSMCLKYCILLQVTASMFVWWERWGSNFPKVWVICWGNISMNCEWRGGVCYVMTERGEWGKSLLYDQLRRNKLALISSEGAGYCMKCIHWDIIFCGPIQWSQLQTPTYVMSFFMVLIPERMCLHFPMKTFNFQSL